MNGKIYRLSGTLLLSLFILFGVACTTAPFALTDEIPASASAPSASVIASEVDKWMLWTGDTQLRGANIYQRRVYIELDGAEFMGPGPVGPPLIQQDFDDLAAMGANYANLSHPGLFTETTPFTLDMDIQNNLDDLLTKSAQADMFAVISFRTGPGRSEFTFFWDEVGDWFSEDYLNDSMWQDQAAQDAWVEMWRYTAQRYRNNPIVAGYDLMVEPNSNEVGSDATHPLDIWDPDEFYANHGGSLYDWNQLYPRIVTAIRKVDPDTPILIGGMGYSAVEWLPYMQILTDTRTVYMVHQYAPFTYTHQASDSTTCTYPGSQCDLDWDGIPDLLDRVWLENNVFSITDAFSNAHSVPLAVNEFGLMRWEPGAGAFMNDQMDLLEARGMNHALWEWTSLWEPLQAENDAFDFRHGPDPNNHTNVSSALSTTIAGYWGRNTIRPSTVLTFTPVATIYLPLVLKNSSAIAGPMALSDLAYWGYQIQDISAAGAVDALVASHYDMLVLEPTRTDSGEKDFDTKGMVSRLKNSKASDGVHRKLIIAYIDIGEAEDWRWYWDWSKTWDCQGDPPGY